MKAAISSSALACLLGSSRTHRTARTQSTMPAPLRAADTQEMLPALSGFHGQCHSRVAGQTQKARTVFGKRSTLVEEVTLRQNLVSGDSLTTLVTFLQAEHVGTVTPSCQRASTSLFLYSAPKKYFFAPTTKYNGAQKSKKAKKVEHNQ